MQASIVKGSHVLFKDIRVSLIEDAAQNIWGGFAYLLPRAEMVKGEYRLKLEDGRSGAVSVVSVRERIAMFRGSGPLTG